MMINKKSINRRVNRALEDIAAAMPTIPYIMRPRRRPPIAAYLLGSIGIAVASGIAALMFFSPRMRSRALNAAKDTYGKVNERLIHRRTTVVEAAPMSNGLVERVEESATNA
jgi:hypothetical protein